MMNATKFQPPSKKTVAVLLTCHNRINYTVRCLSALYDQTSLEAYDFAFYLVDDGSNDKTGEIVKRRFPNVNVFRGSGELFWAGGMRYAWERALEKDYDFYFLVNDDTFLYENAVGEFVNVFERLRDAGERPGAVVGTVVDPRTGFLSYGGRLRDNVRNGLDFGKLLVAKEDPLQCDVTNANALLISKETVGCVGILDVAFKHSLADFDYSLRISKKGLTCWIAPGVHGECCSNEIAGSFLDSSLRMRDRIAKLKRPTGAPDLSESFVFMWRHGRAAKYFLWPTILLRIYMPWLWLTIKDLRKRGRGKK